MWNDDQGYKDWVAFMNKYYPEGDKTDGGNVVGFSVPQTLVQVLKQCGDDLTRENVMKQAANLKNLTVPMLLPDGSDEQIESGFVGVLGAFEIYRGSARGHRMANLRIILG